MTPEKRRALAGALMCMLLGTAALFQFLKLLSPNAEPDFVFTAKVLSFTALAAGLVCGGYAAKGLLTFSLRLREPNEAEAASYRAEFRIARWVFCVLVAGLLMAFTESFIRLDGEPTPYMQQARKFTIIFFVACMLVTPSVLRRLGAELLRPVNRSKKYLGFATLYFCAFAVSTLVAANLPPPSPETVGEVITGIVKFAQLGFCVVGLIYAAVGVWHMRRRRILSA